MSEQKPKEAQPEREKEIERKEDQEGIPGYGQPPKEVRTTHPELEPSHDWGKKGPKRE